MGVGLIFDELLNLFQGTIILNQCECSSDDIAIKERYTLGFRNHTIIKCRKCNREIKRRTLQRALKAWNKNNPNKGGAK